MLRKGGEKKEDKKESKKDLEDIISKVGGDLLGSGVQLNVQTSLEDLKKSKGTLSL